MECQGRNRGEMVVGGMFSIVISAERPLFSGGSEVTPLHLAVQHNRVAVVQRLLAANAAVDYQEDSGRPRRSGEAATRAASSCRHND